jgi:hypothetical protein
MLTYCGVPDAYSAVRLNLTRTGQHRLALTWPSSTGVIYRTLNSTNANGPWDKTFSPVLGNGQQKSISIPANKHVEYFKMTEVPLDGSTSLTNGQSMTGTTTINITALVSSGDILSIGLWDIYGNTTNVLDYIDIRDPSRRSFMVDTVYMRNGQHRLQLELIAQNTVAYSETVSVVVTNAISVVSQVPTEFMRYVEFLPYTTNGRYSVIVRDDQGLTVQSTNRTMSGALSTNGTLVFRDGSARYTNVYSSTYFDYFVTLIIGSTSYTHTFRSPTVQVFNWMEGTVIAQVPDGIITIEESELDVMLLNIITYFNVWGEPFFFDTLRRESSNERWNILSPSTYNICNEYLKGSYQRAPSHVHFYGIGGPDYLSMRTSDSYEGISTATLSGLSLSNRPTFIFFDGFALPKSILTVMTGMTDISFRLSREDLLRLGRRPRVVFYWKENPFPYTGEDVSVAHNTFITDLYTELWAPDFTGLPAQTIDVALAKLRIRYPDIMNKLGVAGSFVNMYIDETITHQ